jgi:hypothetical protein
MIESENQSGSGMTRKERGIVMMILIVEGSK